jgi:DNA recombination protein RmuC
MHAAAVGKLSQGRGNLVRQAEMLRELGVAPSKRLPGSLQDLAATDPDDEPA